MNKYNLDNANTSSVSSNFCSPYPSTVFNNNYTNNIITNTNSGNASPVNHSLEFSNSTDSTLVSIALPQSTLYQPHQNSFLTSKSLSGNQINNSSAFTKSLFINFLFIINFIVFSKNECFLCPTI